jgi:D-alanine-D-alanine ligase
MKRQIAVVAGGDSGEYGISLQSGRVVYYHIDKELYTPYLIIIRGTDWHVTLEDGREIEIDKKDFTFTLDGKKIRFDLAFIAVHGSPGEDGKLQGYFDMLKLPYTTCSQSTSALTFNKFFSKKVVGSFWVETAKCVLLTDKDNYHIEKVLRELTLPVFVKPNKGGSSVGVSKVKQDDELEEAILKAFKEDDEVIIEENMPGREITCAVMKHGKALVALPLTEIISKKEFFDFEAKYVPGMAEEVTPAVISKTEENLCKTISLDLYEKLNCKGIVRFDYIFNDSQFKFLEVNTVPGLTENSIVPRMAEANGMSKAELFSDLIRNALGS